jgi:23S rRNA pseudouridine2604 synthase
MATIKLKKNPAAAPPAHGEPRRAPVRGIGSGLRQRPTLAQAQAQRAERDEQERRTPQERPAAARERPPGPRARPADPRGRSGDPRERAHDPRARSNDPRRGPADARGGAPGPAVRGPRPEGGQPPRPPHASHPPSAPAAGGGHAARAFNPARSAPPAEHRGGPQPVAKPPRAPSVPVPPASGPAHVDGSLRLSKRMSELGLASRREADEWIARGWVRVDGAVVAELGARVLPEQQVTIDKRARGEQARRVTVLINKPIGYVSGQAEDGYEPASVLVVPANQWPEDRAGIHFLREHLKHLAPAGRLDIDSTGLLVLTQDGRIAKQLIGADSTIEKEYLVRVEQTGPERLDDEGLRLLNHGLELDGEALKPARVEWLNDDQLRFVLTEGKKRQIRRMCDLVGLKVIGLKRVRIGRVMLGDLPVGQWRYLREDELFV